MTSWFRAQVKEHGLLAATLLLSRVVVYRFPVVISNKFLAHTHECPCCGWQGRRFLDYIETGYRLPNAACPNCDSHPRHRAFFQWLKNDFQVENKTGKLLVFAPEPALAPLFSAAQKLSVINTDIESVRDVDVVSDVMRLPFANKSVELIWCHHVLEQVKDDRAAMRELHRVLKTNGELVTSAGWTGRDTTLEFGYANKALSGNRRLYGSDFGERLEEAGFRVEPMTYNLSATELERYGVSPETFYYCTIRS